MKGDNRRRAAYAPTVPQSVGHSSGGAAKQSPSGKRTRRPSSPTETARRKAWAAEWGSVGAEYRRERLAREGKT